MVTRFDTAQMDARDRVWYYGLTPAYCRIVRWLMDNWLITYNGVRLSEIAHGTNLNVGTVRLALAALEQFGYVRLAWKRGYIWRVYPMHGFDDEVSDD